MALVKVDDATAAQLAAEGRGDVQTEEAALCQNGDGRLAVVVVVNLADSSTDIMCMACNLAMWAAVLDQLTGAASTDAVDAQAGTV